MTIFEQVAYCDADLNCRNMHCSTMYDRLKIPIDEADDMLPHKEMGQLTFEEKKFLLSVERGDVATVRRSVLVRNCLNVSFVLNVFLAKIVSTLFQDAAKSSNVQLHQRKLCGSARALRTTNGY